jgi:peptidoglycan/xylan/chitin deacetylase (PgdA/CDA1 family)
MLGDAKSSAVRWAFDRAMVRALCERMTRHCPRILMYHRFSAEPADRKLCAAEFARQMSFLREHAYNVVPVAQLALAMERREVPPRTVVVTIDDGYLDFHRHALPVLREFRIPATIFVATDFIDQSIWLWPDVVEFALMTSGRESVRHARDGAEQTYALGSPAERRRVWSEIGDHLLIMTESQRRAAIAVLCAQLQVQVPTRPPDEYCAMTWQQVRECHEAGVEIGAHTRTHPILTSVAAGEADFEIRGSKSAIEAYLGVPCRSFAYPNGTPIDYNPAVKQMVAAAGFSNATVAFHDGARHQDLYELRRFSIGANFERFRRAVCGAEQLTLEIKGRFNGH